MHYNSNYNLSNMHYNSILVKLSTQKILETMLTLVSEIGNK